MVLPVVVLLGVVVINVIVVVDLEDDVVLHGVVLVGLVVVLVRLVVAVGCEVALVLCLVCLVDVIVVVVDDLVFNLVFLAFFLVGLFFIVSTKSPDPSSWEKEKSGLSKTNSCFKNFSTIGLGTSFGVINVL